MTARTGGKSDTMPTKTNPKDRMDSYFNPDFTQPTLDEWIKRDLTELHQRKPSSTHTEAELMSEYLKEHHLNKGFSRLTGLVAEVLTNVHPIELDGPYVLSPKGFLTMYNKNKLPRRWKQQQQDFDTFLNNRGEHASIQSVTEFLKQIEPKQSSKS
eukprot:714370-Rhodomonas_salina.1